MSLADDVRDSDPRQPNVWVLAGTLMALLAAGAVVYIKASEFEFLELDDVALIRDNPYVNRGLNSDAVAWAFAFVEQSGLATRDGVSNVWTPLTFLSHALDVELWGLDANRHHITNLAIHLVNTALAFGFFYLLSKKRILVAAFVASVFCFHPMRVESVAWVSERKDVLSGLFIFLCLLLYHAWASRTARGSYQSRGTLRLLYGGAVAAFIAGCLAKPSTVFLPGILVLIDTWPLKRFEVSPRWSAIRDFVAKQVREKWLFLGIACVISGVSVLLQYGGSHQRFISGLPLTQRMFEMPALILYYLERSILPVNLFPGYPRYPHQFVPYSALAVGIIFVVTVAAWKLRKRSPSLFFGWAWFFICVAPVIGLVYVGTSFSSDRYTYIAHCGLAFSLAHGMLMLAAKRPRLRTLLLITGVFLVAAMGGQSFRQVDVWRDTGSLYRYGVKAQPRSSAAWNNLGAFLLLEGRADESIECFRSALQIGEDYDVYYNLGLALGKTGASVQEQAAALNNSIRIHPDYVPALRTLGFLLTDKRSSQSYDPAAGCLHLERACDLLNYRPTNQVVEILQRLMVTLRESGDLDGYARVVERAEAAGVVRVGE